MDWCRCQKSKVTDMFKQDVLEPLVVKSIVS